MKLDADSPGRRLAQVLADAAVLVWLVMWLWAGSAVHDATIELAVPGEQITESATGISSAMTEAGSVLGDLRLADGLGLVVALVPISIVAAFHVPVRIRFVRRANRRCPPRGCDRGPRPLRAPGARPPAVARARAGLGRPRWGLAPRRSLRDRRPRRAGAAVRRSAAAARTSCRLS